MSYRGERDREADAILSNLKCKVISLLEAAYWLVQSCSFFHFAFNLRALPLAFGYQEL